MLCPLQISMISILVCWLFLLFENMHTYFKMLILIFIHSRTGWTCSFIIDRCSTMTVSIWGGLKLQGIKRPVWTSGNHRPVLWFGIRGKGFGGRAGGCLWYSGGLADVSWWSPGYVTDFLVARTKDDLTECSWAQTPLSTEDRNSTVAK